MPDLPTGTVTFLFSDIEGSTRLLQRTGGERYAELLGEHQALLRAAWAAHQGVEIGTEGDSFFVAFPSAPAAVAAAAQATQALAAHPWPEDGAIRVRIGLHTGLPALAGDNYIGLDVHRAARIAAAGHGGQIVLSAATRALAEPELPPGTRLRDLGECRLKDLQRPEHLSQLVLDDLPSNFPPLKSLDTRSHNLPIQPTLLLGREQVLAAACTLLRRENVRLVTLTGPGGIGKTRLAIQVAAELLDDFPDGVWLVRLSRLTDPALVLPTVAQTLGLREQGSQSIAEILRVHLRDRRQLLVLDNFEQVVGAAPEVAALLEAAPRIKVLVTSRVTLHLRGERDQPLAPLALPDPSHLPPPEGLSQYAAVALFVERAQAARPDFAVTAANAPTIAEICTRLDGLPLAIELAAARVTLLPPEALLARLSPRLKLLTGGPRDLEARQQTMRATIAWSEDLLGPEERTLFCRLAVFVGGCTLEAAEAVCIAPEGAEPLELDLLDGLGTLVDQSLIQQREEEGEPRFSMLHVVREFALEQLEQSDDALAAHQAHATYFKALGEEAEPHLWGFGQAEWLRRLEGEHDNLRAALGWLRDHGEVESALLLAVAIGNFWFIRGHYEEGARWLESLLASLGPFDAAVHVRALYRAGMLAWMRGDASQVEVLAEEALALARASGDREGIALALFLRSFAADLAGELEPAAEYAEQAVAAAREAGARGTLGARLINLGRVRLMLGELEQAQAAAAEGLELLRAQGDEEAQALCLEVLSAVACRRGDTARGRQHAEEALELYQRLVHPSGMATCLVLLAGVAARVGKVERTARLLGFADSMVGHSQTYSGQVRHGLDALLSSAREALGEEAWAAALAAGRALSLEEAIAEALGEGGEGADA
jgi:predicted ATPase/class 3 adenylate cyclase